MPAHIVCNVRIDDLSLAVELARHPNLKDKQVIMGPNPRRKDARCKVIAASRSAKHAGVAAGMPISSALRLIPQAVFLRPDPEVMQSASREVEKILGTKFDLLERVSVADWFATASFACAKDRSPEEFCRSIIDEVWRQCGLALSIGCGPNKVVASVACRSSRPGSAVVVRPREVNGFLFALPVRVLPGVGEKSKGVLGRLGIETIGQLARAPRESLVREFGSYGRRLHRLARGIDETPVREPKARRSIMRSFVFPDEVADFNVVSSGIKDVAAEVWNEVAKESRPLFRTVGVMVRFGDGDMRARQRTLAHPTGRLEDLEELASTMVAGIVDFKRPVRAISIAVAGLSMVQSSQRRVGDYSQGKMG